MQLRSMLLGAVICILAFTTKVAAQVRPAVDTYKITVLSTMLADKGIGEWGYAALVEADGRRILFDTGARPETVLRNAAELGIDLSTVEDVVLSHNHLDHTGGLLTLRRELMKKNARAMSRVHVVRGIFFTRPRETSRNGNGIVVARAAYEATGGRFIIYDQAAQLAPGVWLSGPVPRRYPEKNYAAGGRVQTDVGIVADTIPEDASIFIKTRDGIVVLTGCGHAGIINISEHARTLLGPESLHAIVGGLHLYDANDRTLAWTAEQLKARGLRHLLAGHCTGIEATYVLRSLTGLSRKSAVVSAVGSSFSSAQGIDPLGLAK